MGHGIESSRAHRAVHAGRTAVASAGLLPRASRWRAE